MESEDKMTEAPIELQIDKRRTDWIKAYTKAQKELPDIGKGSRVSTGSYSYAYAALPDIFAKVNPTLWANGLTIAQSVAGSPGVVEVETRIYHTGGHVEIFGPLVIGAAGNAQAVGSAITYARRYALTAALGIAPDEDDDGQKTTSPAPRPVSPKDILWERVQIFKAWNRETKIDRIKEAMESLAIDEITDTDLADRVFAHLEGNYPDDPQLDLEEGYQ